MKLEEDNRTNRMEESLQLFGEVSGSQFFADKDISWILFLNKSDLFREKIKTRPVSNYLKDFPAESPPPSFYLHFSCSFLTFLIPGPDLLLSEAQSFEDSVRFIQDLYEKKYRGTTSLYCYTTCAIDTENCEKVFSAVRDTVLTGALEEAGF